MVVEGIHVEDIFKIVSLVLSLITHWTFRILAHEEDQYTDFLSVATLKPSLINRFMLFLYTTEQARTELIKGQLIL